jgi:signal transduction histidine kinase
MVEEAVNGNVQHLRRMLMINLGVCLLITLVVLTIVFLTIQQYQKRLLLQNETVSQQAQELEGNNQRLTELNYQKDEFMKLVVHDLKTPLGGMVGLSRLIQEENDSALVLQYAVEVESAANEMTDLVQALLDLKEVETAVTPVLAPVDLRGFLTDKNEAWELLAKKKMIRIKLEGVPDSVWIHSHDRWAKVILDNLVSNAIKYSPEGTQVTIRLDLAESVVRVQVIDQGPGILPEERPLLFKQFSRLSSRPTAGESSSGLGLYIVKTMTERLGGTVDVESVPGHGCCFWIEFPRAAPDGC